MFKKSWLLLLSALILTGCTSVDIYSNKDATYNKKLDRIVIVDNLREEPLFGSSWEPAVQNLSTALTKRGISVQIVVPRMVIQSEKGKDLKEAIETFKPTQVMELIPSKYRTGQNFTEYTLLVSIYDVMQKKSVWKSSITVMKGGFSFLRPFSDKLPNDLIQKLEADGFIMPVVAQQATVLAKKSTQ